MLMTLLRRLFRRRLSPGEQRFQESLRAMKRLRISQGRSEPGESPVTIGDLEAAGVLETRRYIYAFVTPYGEEGPPSDPTEYTP